MSKERVEIELFATDIELWETRDGDIFLEVWSDGKVDQGVLSPEERENMLQLLSEAVEMLSGDDDV